MIHKTALFLLGLSLFCFIQGTTQQTCQLKFFYTSIAANDYIFIDENNAGAPFTGWFWTDDTQTEQETRTYSSLRAVQGEFCEDCTLAVFSSSTFKGQVALYDFNEGSEFTFPFCAKSYDLDCPNQEEEEEEEEEQEAFLE